MFKERERERKEKKYLIFNGNFVENATHRATKIYPTFFTWECLVYRIDAFVLKTIIHLNKCVEYNTNDTWNLNRN